MKPFFQYYYYYGGPPKNPKENDIEQLIRFIEDCSETIFFLMQNNYLNKGFFNVFPEIEKATFKLNEWIQDVQTKVKQSAKKLKTKIRTTRGLNKIWNDLDLVGLTGVQLESKLNFWNALFDKIRNWLADTAELISDAFLVDLKNALRATNIVLKSLIKIFPAFEPLVELKDFFELSLEFIS